MKSSRTNRNSLQIFTSWKIEINRNNNLLNYVARVKSASLNCQQQQKTKEWGNEKWGNFSLPHWFFVHNQNIRYPRNATQEMYKKFFFLCLCTTLTRNVLM